MCAIYGTSSTAHPLSTPRSVGEVNSGYTYVPVDAFPVVSSPGENCVSKPFKYVNLPDAFPDNAVRMLIESVDASGNITYLTSKVAGQYQRYRVIVDYINADTVNVPIWLAKSMHNSKRNLDEWIDPIAEVGSDYVAGTETYEVFRDPLPEGVNGDNQFHEYFLPVYVGIGLRVSASVYTTGANVNISGIGVIGAAADANQLTGSLIVQTLGVNGKAINSALPIQSDLNRTTAENAIVAVGTIKALLYSGDTREEERIVGIYLPFNGGQTLVNALLSALTKYPVVWQRPCQDAQSLASAVKTDAVDSKPPVTKPGSDTKLPATSPPPSSSGGDPPENKKTLPAKSPKAKSEIRVAPEERRPSRDAPPSH